MSRIHDVDADGNKIGPYTATVADVAKLYGVTRTTVYNWLDSDDPPPHRRVGVGKNIRFNLVELDEWMVGRAA